MGGKGAWNRAQWVCLCLSFLNLNNFAVFLVSVLAAFLTVCYASLKLCYLFIIICTLVL
jgi:hypothetical protein